MAFARDLARWVLEFDGDEIPATVLDHTKNTVLDAVGCAFAALDEHSAQGTLRAVRAIGGVPDCTAVGLEERVSLPSAVLLNGVLVRTLDLNDLGIAPGRPGIPATTSRSRWP